MMSEPLHLQKGEPLHSLITRKINQYFFGRLFYCWLFLLVLMITLGIFPLSELYPTIGPGGGLRIPWQDSIAIVLLVLFISETLTSFKIYLSRTKQIKRIPGLGLIENYEVSSNPCNCCGKNDKCLTKHKLSEFVKINPSKVVFSPNQITLKKGGLSYFCFLDDLFADRVNLKKSKDGCNKMCSYVGKIILFGQEWLALQLNISSIAFAKGKEIRNEAEGSTIKYQIDERHSYSIKIKQLEVFDNATTGVLLEVNRGGLYEVIKLEYGKTSDAIVGDLRIRLMGGKRGKVNLNMWTIPTELQIFMNREYDNDLIERSVTLKSILSGIFGPKFRKYGIKDWLKKVVHLTENPDWKTKFYTYYSDYLPSLERESILYTHYITNHILPRGIKEIKQSTEISKNSSDLTVLRAIEFRLNRSITLRPNDTINLPLLADSKLTYEYIQRMKTTLFSKNWQGHLRNTEKDS